MRAGEQSEQRRHADGRGLRHVGRPTDLLEVFAGNTERSNFGPSHRLVVPLHLTRLEMDEAVDRVQLCAPAPGDKERLHVERLHR